MATTVTRIPDEVLHGAKAIASLQGKTTNEVLVDAWQEYLEGHRDGRQLRRSPLEGDAGLADRLAADVHACDPHAVGQPAGGAGEDEAENHRGQRSEGGEDRRPLDEDPALGLRPRTPPSGPDQRVFPPPRQAAQCSPRSGGL